MRIWLLVVVLGGCVGANTVACPDGTVCATGKVCAAVTLTDQSMVSICVTPTQVMACASLAESDACGDRLSCHGGACVADGCGDQLRDSTEVCDDGNTADGDGCAADCRSNEQCVQIEPEHNSH